MAVTNASINRDYRAALRATTFSPAEVAAKAVELFYAERIAGTFTDLSSAETLEWLGYSAWTLAGHTADDHTEV